MRCCETGAPPPLRPGAVAILCQKLSGRFGQIQEKEKCFAKKLFTFFCHTHLYLGHLLRPFRADSALDPTDGNAIHHHICPAFKCRRRGRRARAPAKRWKTEKSLRNSRTAGALVWRRRHRNLSPGQIRRPARSMLFHGAQYGPSVTVR